MAISNINGNSGIEMPVLLLGEHGQTGQEKRVLLLLGVAVRKTTNSEEERKERLVAIGATPMSVLLMFKTRSQMQVLSQVIKVTVEIMIQVIFPIVPHQQAVVEALFNTDGRKK